MDEASLEDASRSRSIVCSAKHQQRHTRTVGVTEWHGMLQEQARTPPLGIRFVEASRRKSVLNQIFRSPIKGFFPVIDDPRIDIVESIISPAWCNVPWICSVANYQEVLAFSLLGLPMPRRVRRLIVEPLFRSRLFLGFTFWSHAGLRTMTEYGGVTADDLPEKAQVVYPAIGCRPDRQQGLHGRDILLFGGDFFRKGGVHVVDAFEEIMDRYPGLTLRLCCDPATDFNTSDRELRQETLVRIASNPRIVVGRVSRTVMTEVLMPRAIAYLLPTYDETFGFTILEAMSTGVPVIATNEFAIPEMVEHEVTGFLLEYSETDKRAIMDGYVLRALPASIRRRISDELTQRIKLLLDNPVLADQLGVSAQRLARTRFSVEARNSELTRLYARADQFIARARH